MDLANELERHARAPVRASARAHVAAPPDVVWSTLADVASWPTWNGAVARAALDGALAVGATFRWKAGGLSIRSRLLEVARPGALSWCGRSLGLRAVHRTRFEPDAGGTLVTVEESFDGLLPRLLRGPSRRALERAVQDGLASLKAESERRVRT
ncbi:MAG: SRPBCC family protein [Planctomycetes bacterium]|nr:SRPBCC family protein [Planctomycetota bacterium]